MKYTHESEELNNLLGRRVRLTFTHGKTAEGLLIRGNNIYNKAYEIKVDVGSFCFNKSEVKKIEVVR